MSFAKPTKFILADPDNVPTRTVDTVGTLARVNGQIYLTLGTNRGGQDDNGQFVDAFVVAARLRLNIDVARVIRDVLDVQIKQQMAPPTKPN